MLPVTAFAYHQQIRYVFSRFEHPISIYIKIAATLIYFGILILTFALQSLSLKIMASCSFIGVPTILLAYTYGLFNSKFLSGSRPGSCRASNPATNEEPEEEGEQQVNMFNQEAALD